MKFRRVHKIWKAVKRGRSGGRAMNRVHLEIADGSARLLATDGMILAVVPVAVDENDQAGAINARVVRAAAKGGVGIDAEVITGAHDEACLGGGARLSVPQREPEEEPPPFELALQAIAPKPGREVVRVSLDPRRLWKLAQAIGVGEPPFSGVVLEFQPGTKEPILVIGLSDAPKAAGVFDPKDAGVPFGALMPITRPTDEE